MVDGKLMTKSVGEAFFGRKIPFLELLGARAEHREKGLAVVSIDVREELTNSWKFAHGGVVMSLLDVAMGTAARTANGRAVGIITVNLSVSFLRSCSGVLRAEGRVLRRGRSLVFCDGEVRDAGGDVMAKGIGTFRLKSRTVAG